MKVVLDSNIIIADFWLESTNFKVLFESARNGHIKIYIPEIVLDEVINKYVHRLEESKNKIDSELKTYKKLSRVRIKNPLTKTNIDKSVSDYKKHLSKIVKENSINVVKYPETKHKFLAHKAMNKSKPFNSNEKGYRDCLIWENVKTLLTDYESAVSQPELVFISNNYKDFATSEYELHADLISELENEDFDSKSVIVYPQLSEFNDKQTKLFFEQSESFEKKLKENKFWNLDLRSEITEYLYKNYVDSELYRFDLDSDNDSSESTVKGFYEDFKMEIREVKKLSATEYLVDIDIDVITEIDLFIDKRDYWAMDDKSNILIQDPDWNDWVMWASTEELVNLKMALIINDELKINSCQIDQINKNYAQHFV
ncbi:MAG: PIN domain-containing protein [Mangrovibacterium sp.]